MPISVASSACTSRFDLSFKESCRPLALSYVFFSRQMLLIGVQHYQLGHFLCKLPSHRQRLFRAKQTRRWQRQGQPASLVGFVGRRPPFSSRAHCVRKCTQTNTCDCRVFMGMHCGPVPTLFNILEAAPGCWGANVSTTSPRQLLGSNRKVVKVSWSELSVASHKNHHTGGMLPVKEGRCKSPCQVWFTCLCKQRQLPSDNWQRTF